MVFYKNSTIYKMKKTLFIAVFSVLIIPQVAFGAWWNPFTWGKQPAAVIQVKNTGGASTDTQATTTVVEKVVEKPVEKVVTQTIKINDPAQQAKIDALIAENIALKAKLTQVEKDFGICKIELTENQSKLSSLNNEIVQAQNTATTKEKNYKAAIAELDYKIAQTNARQRDEEAGIFTNTPKNTHQAKIVAEVQKLQAEKAKLTAEFYAN